MENVITPRVASAPLYLPMQTNEDTYYLRDLIGALRERCVVFMAIFTLIAGPAIWIIISLQPTYVATARVIIEPNERLRLNVESAVSGITLDNESVRSEVEVLKSPQLAQRVLDKQSAQIIQDLEARKIGFFAVLAYLKEQLGIETKLPPPLVGRFLQRVIITPVERSRVITVSYRSYNPDVAAEVSNTIAQEYIEMALELKREGTRDTANWLGIRLIELQRSIDNAERAIEEHRRKYDLVQGDGTGLISERLNQANISLMQARTRLADLTSRVDRLFENNATDRIPEVLNSYVVQRLRTQEADVAREIADLATVTGEASPTLIGKRNSLARVRALINEETARIRFSLQNDMEIARVLYANANQEIEALTRRMSDLRTATIGLRALEREAGATQAIYENVLLRMKDVVAQESFLRRDARIIGMAVPPTSASSFSPILMIFGAMCSGLLTAGAFVRVIAHLEPGFRRVSDIERTTRINVLSAVPKIKFGTGKHDVIKPLADDQRSLFAESIDVLLGRIMLQKADQDGTVLTVNSCLSGDGKTHLALAMAHFATRIGYRCLIIDGDFRAPKLSRSFGLQNKPGFAELLAQTRRVEDSITSIGDSGLFFLPAGQATEKIQRLLSGEVLPKTIEKLSQQFDLIIIDTSPITAASEPEALARIADQVLLVVRWKHTPRALVQECAARLSKSTGSFSGIVLSQVSGRNSKIRAYSNL